MGWKYEILLLGHAFQKPKILNIYIDGRPGRKKPCKRIILCFVVGKAGNQATGTNQTIVLWNKISKRDFVMLFVLVKHDFVMFSGIKGNRSKRTSATE